MFPALTESMLRRALRQKDVRVNGRRVGQDVPLIPGDTVDWYIDDRYLFPSVPVLYRDERLLVAEKPAGIPVQGAGGVAEILSGQEDRPVYPVHRLDVMTRGLLLLAGTPQAQEALVRLIRQRHIQKQYRCLVVGAPPQKTGVVENFLSKNARTATVTVCAPNAPGAKPAKTGYRLLRGQNGLSELEITLYTGRTHQIRVHMAHLGCPILGDDKYGDRAANRAFHASGLSLCADKLVLLEREGLFADLCGRVFEIPRPFGEEWD